MQNRFAVMFAAFFLFCASVSFAQVLNSKVDSLSYIFGMNLAENIKRQGIKEVDHEILSIGFADAMANRESLIDKKSAEAFLNAFMNEHRSLQQKAEKEEGELFLAENAKRKEVRVLSSGLQYEVLKSGSGPKPKATDKVLTHYHGMLINGNVFDSSVNRGEPITFGVNQVIKGWQEALQLMSVGDKWKLFIPYDLAYREKGAGGSIPPFATLIFDVELLEIKE
jgi:FKBP-type peptidyl-prolyl cis-trans isomerase FklB